MFAKIITPLIVILANIAAGVIFFFTLILSLNGYNGTDGERGLAAFILWTVISILLTGTLSFFTVNYFINRRRKSPMFAALVSIPAFSCLAVALNFAGVIIGIIVAETNRNGF